MVAVGRDPLRPADGLQDVDRPVTDVHRLDLTRPLAFAAPPPARPVVDIGLTGVAEVVESTRIEFDTGSGNWNAEKRIDGILIRVAVDRCGTIVTAHPLEGPGVVHNP